MVDEIRKAVRYFGGTAAATSDQLIELSTLKAFAADLAKCSRENASRKKEPQPPSKATAGATAPTTRPLSEKVSQSAAPPPLALAPPSLALAPPSLGLPDPQPSPLRKGLSARDVNLPEDRQAWAAKQLPDLVSGQEPAMERPASSPARDMYAEEADYF